MLYEGFGSGLAGQVGLATSLDGKKWARHPKNPVMTNALGDQFDIAIDSIVKVKEVYYAYGHYDSRTDVAGESIWAGGMFSSNDLIKWTAYPGNPILDNSAVMVANGANLLMYGISSNPDGLAPYYVKRSTYSGFAGLPKSPGAESEPAGLISSPPPQFALHNYPNPFGRLPFNAQTSIEYTLPLTSSVQLIIYNVFGQLVRRLSQGRQAAGHYRVVWDGKDAQGKTVPSGIYYCHLKAGKMILVRPITVTK
jgi:hypothetical protein